MQMRRPPQTQSPTTTPGISLAPPPADFPAVAPPQVTLITKKVPYIDVYSMVENLCKLGLTNKEIAECLGISAKDLQNCIQSDDVLFDVMQRAKDTPNKKVEAALFKKALGHEAREIEMDGEGNVKRIRVRELTGDVTAQIFWLKNRDRTRWQDINQIDVKVTVADRLALAHESLSNDGHGK